MNTYKPDPLRIQDAVNEMKRDKLTRYELHIDSDENFDYRLICKSLQVADKNHIEIRIMKCSKQNSQENVEVFNETIPYDCVLWNKNSKKMKYQNLNDDELEEPNKSENNKKLIAELNELSNSVKECKNMVASLNEKMNEFIRNSKTPVPHQNSHVHVMGDLTDCYDYYRKTKDTSKMRCDDGFVKFSDTDGHVVMKLYGCNSGSITKLLDYFKICEDCEEKPYISIV